MTKTPQKEIESAVERHKNRRAERRAKARECLRPCDHCGFFHEAAMDWHHRDPSMKEGRVSFFIQQAYSWKRIKAEMDKCDMLCANCHRILHSKENDC